MADIDAILVVYNNPGSLLQIKDTRAQFFILRRSTVYKFLVITCSELTSRHDVFDTHESHSTYINSLCNNKTAPLAQLMESFAMKNVTIAFVLICANKNFEKKHSYQHQIILS